MNKNLYDLPQNNLINILEKHFAKLLKKYRGSGYYEPTFTHITFVKDKKGRDFLVGSSTSFDENYTYGKDDAHYIKGTDPHFSCGGRTCAVLIENGKLSEEAFDIDFFSDETHTTSDYIPGKKRIKTPYGEKSQIQARVSICIFHFQEKSMHSISLRDDKCHNLADRREIIRLLRTETKKDDEYNIHENTYTLDSQNSSKGMKYLHFKKVSEQDFYCQTAPKEMLDICTTFIHPNEGDYNAAQAYVRHLANQKPKQQGWIYALSKLLTHTT